MNFLFSTSQNHHSPLWTELWLRQTLHHILTRFFLIPLWYRVCVCHDWFPFCLMKRWAAGVDLWSHQSQCQYSDMGCTHSLWWLENRITAKNDTSVAEMSGWYNCLDIIIKKKGLISSKQNKTKQEMIL